MNNKHVCKVLAFKHVSACGRSCAHVLASLVASDYWLFAHSLIHSFIHPLAVCQPLSSVVGGGGGGGDGDGDGDDAYHGSEWAACDPI